ncbi:helix-hairpin-helix domain-containing protein family protein [Aphelenchoides avenae]|nr:helix-hairpin-helix domain-containing protein family protein [Aphelenchus avenae]
MDAGDAPSTSSAARGDVTNAGASAASDAMSSMSKLQVNRKRQEGNPLLKYIRNVPYEWAAIKADFECGKGIGLLYLSLKYHKLHPGYIETRFPDGNAYNAKEMSVEDASFLLRDINMFCYRSGWTLILSYSVEEAAEYIENLKLAEKRNAQSVINNMHQYKLQRQQGPGYKGPSAKEKSMKLYEDAVKFLSSIRAVSQTDAKRLLSTFGSIQAISKAHQEQLEMCPGLGPIKAQNVYNFFRTSFYTGS